MAKVYLFLATGFELIEALVPLDVLKRGGVEVFTVSLTNEKNVTSSNGVTVICTHLLKDNTFTDGEGYILPGGFPGYENLKKSELLKNLISKSFSDGKLICSICGAATILHEIGLLNFLNYTCHSSVKNLLPAKNYKDEIVVVDKNLITSKGAGTSLDFSMSILEYLTNREVVEKVKKGMEISN